MIVKRPLHELAVCSYSAIGAVQSFHARKITKKELISIHFHNPKFYLGTDSIPNNSITVGINMVPQAPVKNPLK